MHTSASTPVSSASLQSHGSAVADVYWRGTAFQLRNHQARLQTKIWTLAFDLPGSSVNKLDTVVMEDFPKVLAQLRQLHQEKKLDAVVMVSTKPGNFMAGADIKLFDTFRQTEDAVRLCQKGHEIFNAWEDLPFPKVVAIDGVALGGGCEISLASDAILISNSSKAKIGLPEVMLGIIPGLGGCIRLPRKIGLANALDMILTGKQLNGERAFKVGLAEACIPKEDFENSALLWVKKNLSALQSGKRLARPAIKAGMGGWIGAMLESPVFRSSVVFSQAKKGILKATKGYPHYPAPLEALAVVQSTACGVGGKLRGKAREQALARETQGFARCAMTDVSKNLIRVFFLTEEVKKSNGLPQASQAAGKTKGQEVRSAGVLGAGIMGGGIAQLLADKGIPSRMKDISLASLETGMQSAAKIFKGKLKKRSINPRQYQQKMNLIAPTLDFQGFAQLDVVVEAVIEKMDIKKSVLKELEGKVSENSVIASNTSSLSISEMQSVLSRPERFLGMHFFNPVHRMPLVEVIRGEKTDDRSVVTIYEFAKALGKTPIVVKNGAGFLVNRLLVPYMNEAMHLLAEGVPMETVDKAMIKFGMPMGPLELIDEVGVDTGEKVLKILYQAFGERMKPLQAMEKFTAAKRLGKKNALGIYKYTGDKEKLQKAADPETYRLLGITPRPGTVNDLEIVERCVLPMINEAARCLEESVVERAEDVDIGMIFGTGFAPFRGGLLRYADSVGLKNIVEKLQSYSKKINPQRFEPSPAILQRLQNGKNFYD